MTDCGQRTLVYGYRFRSKHTRQAKNINLQDNQNDNL